MVTVTSQLPAHLQIPELHVRWLCTWITVAVCACSFVGLGASAQTYVPPGTTVPGTGLPASGTPQPQIPPAYPTMPEYPPPPAFQNPQQTSYSQQYNNNDQTLADDDTRDGPSKLWFLLFLLLLPCLCGCCLVAFLLRIRKNRRKTRRAEVTTGDGHSSEAASGGPNMMGSQGSLPAHGKHSDLHEDPQVSTAGYSSSAAAGEKRPEGTGSRKSGGTYQDMQESYKASGGAEEMSRPGQAVHDTSGDAWQAPLADQAGYTSSGGGTHGKLPADGTGTGPGTGTNPLPSGPAAKGATYGATGQQLPLKGGLPPVDFFEGLVLCFGHRRT
jgi:hypothetical protein